MCDPGEVDVDRRGHCSAELEQSEPTTREPEEEEPEPVPHRAPREMSDWVALCLSRELVTVPRNDEEVLYVLADDLPVVPPEGSNSIQKECECVQPDVPELLVLIPIVLFQGGNLRKLDRR